MEKESQIRQITAIVAQKRPGRFNVFLNGQYAFPVAESVLIKYRLYKGMEVDQKLLQQISNDDQVAQAYNKMLDYLSHQLRTEHEVEQKLVEIDTPPEFVPVVMAKLRENRLLDDREYAAAYVRTEMNTGLKGPGVIRQKLRQKRVGEFLIDDALTQFTTEQQVENAAKLVQKLAKRYLNQPARRRSEKIHQGVLTQGYGDEVYQLVKENEIPSQTEDRQAELLEREAEKLGTVTAGLKVMNERWRLSRPFTARGLTSMKLISGWPSKKTLITDERGSGRKVLFNALIYWYH